MTGKPAYRLLLVVAATLLLSACESTNIAAIKNDPSKYQNKTVHVAGTVTTSFGALSMGGYEIEDPTGRIFVISNRGIPAKGARVVVEGTVFSGVMLAGQALGVAIKETKHQVR